VSLTRSGFFLYRHSSAVFPSGCGVLSWKLASCWTARHVGAQSCNSFAIMRAGSHAHETGCCGVVIETGFDNRIISSRALQSDFVNQFVYFGTETRPKLIYYYHHRQKDMKVLRLRICSTTTILLAPSSLHSFKRNIFHLLS
jgi:hypothetical protein